MHFVQTLKWNYNNSINSEFIVGWAFNCLYTTLVKRPNYIIEDIICLFNKVSCSIWYVLLKWACNDNNAVRTVKIGWNVSDYSFATPNFVLQPGSSIAFIKKVSWYSFFNWLVLNYYFTALYVCMAIDSNIFLY